MPVKQRRGQRRRARPSAQQALQQWLRAGPVNFRERYQRLFFLNVAFFIFRLARQRQQLAEEIFAVKPQPIAYSLAPVFVKAIRGQRLVKKQFNAFRRRRVLRQQFQKKRQFPRLVFARGQQPLSRRLGRLRTAPTDLLKVPVIQQVRDRRVIWRYFVIGVKLRQARLLRILLLRFICDARRRRGQREKLAEGVARRASRGLLLRGGKQASRAQNEKGQENRATHGINSVRSPSIKACRRQSEHRPIRRDYTDSHRTAADPKNRTEKVWIGENF